MSPDFGQGRGQTPMTEDELVVVRPHLREASSNTSQDGSSSRHGHDGQEGAGVARGAPAGGLMTPAEEAYYARAYSAAEMRTFHCERVRKMPLSGLDPSMLIGFVCRDEAEWIDLRRRIKAVRVFAIPFLSLFLFHHPLPLSSFLLAFRFHLCCTFFL
jgi:cysteine protease ATG4